MFAIDAQRDATGPEYAQIRTAPQEPTYQLGAGVPDVFAVVEDQQDSPRADGLDEAVDWRLRRALIKSEGRGYLLQDKVISARRREIHKIDTVPPLLVFAACELHGQAGLANASEADEFDQSTRVEQIADPRELSGAADEAGQRRRRALHGLCRRLSGGRCQQRRAVVRRKLERLGEPPNRIAVRKIARAPLEIGNATTTQPGACSKRRL
jgi:hypothetical protein